MRITKMGKIPEGRTIAAGCGWCSTEFEFTRADVLRYDFHMSEGPRSTWAEVRCPLCGNRVEVHGTGWTP